MRTCSFVFPPLLLALALFATSKSTAGYPEVSLVQPAIAFSELPDENQIDLIQVVESNIILSSALMESEEFFDEDDELGNASFVDAIAVPYPSPLLRPAPAPFPGELMTYEPFACQTCGPPLPSVCDPCSGYESGCGCFNSGMSPCFDGFALRNKGRSQFFMSTWLSAGATLPSRSPIYEVDVFSRFPDTHNKFIMNQLYLAVGRDVNKYRNSFDIGGRLDLLYGTDYYYTSALGLETKTTYPGGGQIWNLDPKEAASRWNSSNGPRYPSQASLYGLSMPQLYGEFFAPVGLGTTVKAGHFYSMMGYESPMAPENFFYSHTWTMTHGGPMTFTGVVVNQQLTRQLTGLIGYTSGWDIWENPRGTGSFITGFHWSSYDRCAELAFTIHTGNAHADLGTPVRDGSRTNYSLVYSRQLSYRWKWAVQHDLGFEKNAAYGFNPGPTFFDGRWASLVNYLYYTINDKWSAGGRFEWFQDTHNSRIANFPQIPGLVETTGQNYYNLTLGMNWKPVPLMTLRPEIRWDWSDVEVNAGQSFKMFSDFRNNDRFTVALEGFVKF